MAVWIDETLVKDTIVFLLVISNVEGKHMEVGDLVKKYLKQKFFIGKKVLYVANIDTTLIILIVKEWFWQQHAVDIFSYPSFSESSPCS